MSRIASVIGDVFAGYQLPEYTAYSDCFTAFKRLVPIPTVLKAEVRRRPSRSFYLKLKSADLKCLCLALSGFVQARH